MYQFADAKAASLGYTGKITAEYITTNLPTDLKWAVAGRSREKLEKIAAELKSLNTDRRQPGRYEQILSGASVSIAQASWPPYVQSYLFSITLLSAVMAIS